MTMPSLLSADGGGLIALIFVAFIALFIFGVIQQNRRARERRERTSQVPRVALARRSSRIPVSAPPRRA